MVRFYTIYERPRGTRRWTRISDNAYPKQLAIRIYQSRLLEYLLAGNADVERRLRAVSNWELRSAK